MEKSAWRHYRSAAVRGMKLLSLCLYTALFLCLWIRFYQADTGMEYQTEEHVLLAFIYMVLFGFMSRVYGGFQVGMMRISELVYAQFLASVMTNLCIYMMTLLLCRKMVLPHGMLLLQLMETVFIAAWAYAAHYLYAALSKRSGTILVYREKADLNRILAMPYFSNKYDVRARIEGPESDDQILQAIEESERDGEGIDAVFIAGVDATMRNGILKRCLDRDILVYVAPKVGDLLMDGGKKHCFGGEMFTLIQRKEPALEYRIAKRTLDIAVSAIGIAVLSPVMLAVAIAIKHDDGGSVFYRQKRLTKNGRVFEMMKFRSMRMDAEENGVARLAQENDDRITPVGKFIRACRLDELPQLFNILTGDMSLVGPRPERPEIAKRYEETLPAFSLRLQAKAGLTGYAQVFGRYNTQPYQKLLMDLFYINRMSFVMDLRLLMATVKILFMKESTQGIQEGQTTALATEKTERPSDERSKLPGLVVK